MEHLSRAAHVDILIGQWGCIVKADDEASFVAHYCDSVGVEEGACHVGCPNERTHSEWIVILINVQLFLQGIVIEVAVFRHGNDDNVGSGFPPRYQICIMLKNGHQYHRLLGIYLVVILELFEVESVDFRLCVFFIGAEARDDDFTKSTIIRVPAILFTKIDISHELLQFLLVHLLSLLAICILFWPFNLFCDLFDS